MADVPRVAGALDRALPRSDRLPDGQAMRDMPDEPGRELSAAALERGRESGKASLRRLQWKAANAGNTTMLVWMGKQYLSQTDRQDLRHDLIGSFNVKDCSDDQLERIAGCEDPARVMGWR